uniref:Uncharacterized protein n=1 Tax=Pipistrellus kuhlii TaxID=59472 RepID=A0A7J7S6L6_PIPKU|nr:hypothetical protein mPipKuh1_017250 [Pipistrellus kuhlii]
MEASPTRSKERKGSGQSQAATSLTGGSQKPSLSRSEEFLSQISTELTDEALFVAGYRVNSVPSKKMQTRDQGTQIYKHALTGAMSAPRHTFRRPVVTRELCPAA